MMGYFASYKTPPPLVAALLLVYPIGSAHRAKCCLWLRLRLIPHSIPQHASANPPQVHGLAPAAHYAKDPSRAIFP
jgi:hypothetical protein